MEVELNIALSLISSDTKIKYTVEDSADIPSLANEIRIDKYRLQQCPNQQMFISAIQKKIDRSDILKSQKLTLGLCVLILLSRQYSINSLVLTGIPNTFIERCWECLRVVSYTVPDPLQSWMLETIGRRSPANFSTLFCSRRQVSAASFLGDLVQPTSQFSIVNTTEDETPFTVWHRHDVSARTLIIHTNRQS